jgi:hypothetical protein
VGIGEWQGQARQGRICEWAEERRYSGAQD